MQFYLKVVSAFFKTCVKDHGDSSSLAKPSVYSVCELVHNIVIESRRVARTYVGVFHWLISYVVCD